MRRPVSVILVAVGVNTKFKWAGLSSTRITGSSAFVVLGNKEKAVRAGLVRQRKPTQCVRDGFLKEPSLNAVLHWFLGDQHNG
jgi:hypothetical protein